MIMLYLLRVCLEEKINNVSYYIISNTYTVLSFNLFIKENYVTATLFLRRVFCFVFYVLFFYL